MMVGDISNLFDNQLRDWDTACNNYRGLETVLTRHFDFDGFTVLAQCNPERMQSSAAKVDAGSIADRKCFLCARNRPDVQKGIDFGSNYTILVNPFPIFTRHLTIPCKKHVVQLIKGRIADMLELAAELKKYTVFYNGPECGASAPDHFHFQAGCKGFLPAETEISPEGLARLLYNADGVGVYTVENYLRRAIVFFGTEIEKIAAEFGKFYRLFAEMQPDRTEPMMNITADFTDNKYKLTVYARAKHRPERFYAEGDKKILFSPGAVDMGGVLIFPRREDFEKITSEIISEMLGEVSLSTNDFNVLKDKLTDDAIR